MDTDTLIATADACLLAPHDLGAGRLDAVFGALAGRRVDAADLYFQYTRAEGWSLEEGIVKSGSFAIEQGVGVRALSGERTAFAYSDEISFDALQDAARATRAIAAQGSSRKARIARRAAVPRRYEPLDPLASLESSAKVALLERLERLCRARDPRVIQVMASLGGEYEVVLVARADGRLAADVRPLVRLSVQVIAEQNGRRETGSSGGGGRTGYSMFTDEVLETYARQAVDQALVNLEARPAPAGTMTVVLGSGWPGILLHEAIGHGLEGDFNRKGSSAFAGRMGQRVAAPGVTVIDDGTIPGRRGSLTVDDEGNPSTRTVLIENGVLRGLLQDSLNARLMKMPVTGNGRRESYAHLVLPRMTNTYMLAGSHDPAEILRSVKKGLYAVNFGGGQVDITSGKFVFSSSEAYMIEDGKVTYPVRGATLIGNGPDALTRVSMIGNDLKLIGVPQLGLCADILIGAGCVREVETSAVTLGEAGLAPRFTAAAGKKSFRMIDATCPMVHSGLQATEKGVPFMPMRGVIGSDLVKLHPDWKTIDNPFRDGDPLLLAKAIVPDVALFHARWADEAGNVWVGRRKELATIAHASKACYVTFEELKKGDMLEDELLAPGCISSVYVSGVAPAPRGAWPLGVPLVYGIDDAHVMKYARLAKTDEGFRQYLDEFVLKPVPA